MKLREMKLYRENEGNFYEFTFLTMFWLHGILTLCSQYFRNVYIYIYMNKRAFHAGNGALSRTLLMVFL